MDCGELDAGFKLMTDMKDKGIHPNQIVFTTLIKGCIQNNELDRAWRTFNHVRSEIEQPDTVLFSLMIHACSKTMDAEKALDLFHDMNVRQLPITNITFNALIQACSSRQDYYLEAFTLLERMALEGFQPNSHTYHILIKACSTFGDVVRGRMVWNEVVSQLEQPENPDVQSLSPLKMNVQFLQHMLFMYSKACVDYQKGKRFEMDSEMDTPQSTRYPVFISKTLDLETLVKEAGQIWDLAVRLHEKGELKLHAGLLDNQLAFICHAGLPDKEAKALEFYKTAYKKLGVQPTGKTYRHLLYLLSQPDYMNEAQSLFNEFIDWDAQQEKHLLVDPSKYSSVERVETEKEKKRKLVHRDAKTVRYMYLSLIHGYATAKNVDKALETIDSAYRFRHPHYIERYQIREVRAAVELTQAKADDGDWSSFKRILELCPKRTDDPLQEIYHILGSKTIPKNWWGFEAMGVSDLEKKQMLRLHAKAQRKAKQRSQAKSKPKIV